MQKIHFYLLFILLISCSKNNSETKIEVYFLKNKILSEEGVLLGKAPIFERLNLDTVKFYSSKKDQKFDTITNQIIYGGKYSVSENDLEAKPFLNDNDILFLDKYKSQIFLSSSGYEKLNGLDYKKYNGKQYVITVNKKPVINGYLTSSHSSIVHSFNYIIFYDNFEPEKQNENQPLEIKNANSYIVFSKSTVNDLNKYPELIKAFEKTNRIKKPTGNSR